MNPPRTNPCSGIFKRLRGIEFEIHREMRLGMRFQGFFQKFEMMGVIHHHSQLIKRLRFNSEEKLPLRFWIQISAGFHTEDFRYFQKNAAASSHHFFKHGGIHLRLELEKDDMVNHRGL